MEKYVVLIHAFIFPQIAQVEKRYRRRYRRTREENKIEKKVKEMEQIRYGRHKPPPRLHLESLQDFPECGSDTPPNMSPKYDTLFTKI